MELNLRRCRNHAARSKQRQRHSKSLVIPFPLSRQRKRELPCVSAGQPEAGNRAVCIGAGCAVKERHHLHHLTIAGGNQHKFGRVIPDFLNTRRKADAVSFDSVIKVQHTVIITIVFCHFLRQSHLRRLKGNRYVGRFLSLKRQRHRDGIAGNRVPLRFRNSVQNSDAEQMKILNTDV